MSNIVDASLAEVVVYTLNIVATHISGFGTDSLARWCISIGLVAEANLVQAAVWHIERVLCVSIDGVVVGCNAVAVVDSHLRIVRYLDLFVDDTVTDAQGVEVEVLSRQRTIADELVLIVEVVKECWSVVTT